MPRIEKFFATSKVENWMSDSVGASAGGGFCAVGGDTTTYPNPAGGIYVSHAIEATGNFQVTAGSGDVDILIVAGGGSGGNAINRWNAGGGGGGGVRAVTSQPVTSTGGPGGNGIYPIVIGAGGTWVQTGPTQTDAQKGKGNDTTALGLSATGGGVTGYLGAGPPPFNPYTPWAYTAVAIDGGSGGGGVGANDVPGWPAPSPFYAPFETAGSGNEGGYPVVEGYGGGAGAQSPGTGGGAGGGGGGAGAVGTAGATPSPTYNAGGTGGAGVSNVYRSGPGSPLGYGGGGPGSGNPGTPGPPGGFGAGGSGGTGTANTGGAGGEKSPTTVMAGGSGVVVIRYAVPA